jgi:hypothetical protein
VPAVCNAVRSLATSGTGKVGDSRNIVPGTIASIGSAPTLTSAARDGRDVGRVPPVERGRLVVQAFSVGAHLQHRRASVCGSALDDYRHVPARNERAQFDVPAVRQCGQNSRQLVQPRFDLTAVPRDQAPTQSVTEDRRSGLTHVEEQVWTIDDHRCGGKLTGRAFLQVHRWPWGYS